MIRIDPVLHDRLRRAASAASLSLNDYCTRMLSTPSGALSYPAGVSEAVLRATDLFEDDLIGVAAFGSWTRGETADGSDLDLLVVLERCVALGRALYRRWDEAPIRDRGRLLEPHFVHLPDAEETVAGLWAEVALDGIVLFEKDLRVSMRLARVRRDIVSGRIVRQIAHGQPYWVRNEVA